MTQDHRRTDAQMVQEVLLDDTGFLAEVVQMVLQEILEAEMTEHVGAAPYERAAGRKGHRNGHKPRALRTRVGTLKLLVPQDREGTFSTRLFARYQRNEKALCLALMEMYVEGVSTRKVKEVTEALCGTSFSKSLISSLAGSLDSELEAWRMRRLEAEMTGQGRARLRAKSRYSSQVDDLIPSFSYLLLTVLPWTLLTCGVALPVLAWRLTDMVMGGEQYPSITIVANPDGSGSYIEERSKGDVLGGKPMVHPETGETGWSGCPDEYIENVVRGRQQRYRF